MRRRRTYRPRRVRRHPAPLRIGLLIGLAVALVVAMLGRLVQLQAVEGDELARQASEQATRTRTC